MRYFCSMMNLDKLGNRIRLLRIERKLTQENIATELGISVTAYSKIERGLTKLSIPRLESIARVLGISAIKIMDTEYAGNNYQNDGKSPVARDSGIRSYGEYDLVSLVQRIQQQDKEIERMHKAIADKEEIISLLKEKLKD